MNQQQRTRCTSALARREVQLANYEKGEFPFELVADDDDETKAAKVERATEEIADLRKKLQ